MSKHGDDDTWIQTYTGKQFWPLDPHVDDIDIEDIAHALSNVCRYTGHCRHFYSVAQHSVYVADVIAEFTTDPVWVLTALLHDAAEAYIADVARPVKKNIAQYAEIEHRLEVVIAEKFGLLFPFPPEIKNADNVLLVTEKRDLMPKPPRPWKTYGVEPLMEILRPWPSGRAKAEFLLRFGDISERR